MDEGQNRALQVVASVVAVFVAVTATVVAINQGWVAAKFAPIVLVVVGVIGQAVALRIGRR